MSEAINANVDLNEGKAGEIMRSTLLPQHATDPVVVRFIGNYLHTRNIRRAANLSQISPRDAENLFGRPDIYRCIAKLTQEAVVKFGYDAEQVVQVVKDVAFFDPIDLVNPDGTYKRNMHDIPANARMALKSLKAKNIYEEDINGVPQYKGEIIEYTFYDRINSAELLGREKETFKKTTVVQHDVSKNARDFLLDSVRRADAALVALDKPKEVDVIEVVAKPAGFSPLPGRKV